MEERGDLLVVQVTGSESEGWPARVDVVEVVVGVGDGQVAGVFG